MMLEPGSSRFKAALDRYITREPFDPYVECANCGTSLDPGYAVYDEQYGVFFCDDWCLDEWSGVPGGRR